MTTLAEEPKTTVAELILALATYPLDAEVAVSSAWHPLCVTIGESIYEALDEYGANPYVQPEAKPTIVERPADGRDEYATTLDFLHWLKSAGYKLPQRAIGGGQNEPTSYATPEVYDLAVEFAQRPLEQVETARCTCDTSAPGAKHEHACDFEENHEGTHRCVLCGWRWRS